MLFSVYKSSAGSGKTYTLVKEYLKLVLLNPDLYRNILAITFTNKASTEMKERILEYLLQISQFEDGKSIKIKSLIESITEEVKVSKDVLIKNAGKVLENVLHNYSEFGVGTIDSFMHRIIKSFTYELGVPHSFNVEMDEEIVKLAVNLLISKAGIDKSLTEIMVNYMEQQMDDDKKWDITQNIIHTSEILLKDSSVEPLKLLQNLDSKDFIGFVKIIHSYLNELNKSVILIAENILNIIKSKGLTEDSFVNKSRSIYKYFENINKNGVFSIEPTATQFKSMQEGKLAHKEANSSEKDAIYLISAEIIDAFNKLQAIMASEYKQSKLLSIIQSQIFNLALLNDVNNLMNDIKQQKGIVHISDFNKNISKIVLTEPVPFIYERIGEKYKHFLLDEFQDTNILQWQNLLPLLENSLANANFNLIVGDAKQAIYRWRGGEVEQFVCLPKPPPFFTDDLSIERYRMLELNFHQQNLINNFRSKAEIVQFNNDFFEIIKQKSPQITQDIYLNHQQNYDESNIGGCVSIEFLVNSDTQEIETYNNKIIEIIQSLEAELYQWKDICILCRSNDKASAVAINLIENGYNVISEESLLLSKSQELDFIFSLLKNICFPEHDIPKAEILLYLKNKFPEIVTEDISNLFLMTSEIVNGNKNKIINETNLFNISFNSVIERVFPLFGSITKESMNLYDLCERLINICGFNKNADPYIIYFLEAVLDYQNRQSSNLCSFIDWWSEKRTKISIQVPQNIDAIQVMTIHKSKGLDFPVVIYPFATNPIKINNNFEFLTIDTPILSGLNTTLFNSYKTLEGTSYEYLYEAEYKKTFLDVINLVYVAFTRPRERLYIISKKSEALVKSKLDEIKSIDQMLKAFLVQKNLWEEAKNHYTFGLGKARNLKNSDENEQLNYISFEGFESNPWIEKLLIRNEVNNLWKISKTQKQLQWGSLIHDILAQLHHGDDLNSVILTYQLQGFISMEEMEQIENILFNIINHKELYDYFFYNDDCAVKTEAEIISSNGKVYRPDRIVFTPNKAVVIDFKTGKFNNSHKEQLILYANLLKELGFSNIEKLLVYLENAVVINVD